MLKADLITELTKSLGETAQKFDGTTFSSIEQLLTIALVDVSRYCPRTLLGELTVVADEAVYTAPADLIAPKLPIWGDAEKSRMRPWDVGYRDLFPRPALRLMDASTLYLDPAPSAAQIAVFGTSYKFYYQALHVLSDDAGETTLSAGERDALILRGSAQAALVLANAGITKPVQFHNGMQSVPRTATPIVMHENLMKAFRERVS